VAKIVEPERFQPSLFAGALHVTLKVTVGNRITTLSKEDLLPILALPPGRRYENFPQLGDSFEINMPRLPCFGSLGGQVNHTFEQVHPVPRPLWGRAIFLPWFEDFLQEAAKGVLRPFPPWPPWVEKTGFSHTV